MTRKSLSKKTRFEVFKRDSFKCQYCGESSPDVVLEVDHIEPVSKGGTNDITNLITSCFDCNRGKGATKLSDDNVIKKQNKQLEELNERRTQLEMMVEWKKELLDLDNYEVDMFTEYWDELLDGSHSINAHGKKKVKKWLKKYDIEVLMKSAKKSVDSYLLLDEEGDHTSESVEKSFSYIPRIAHYEVNGQEDYMKELFYIRGILKNRLHYLDEKKTIIYLKKLYELDYDLEFLKELALEVKNWTEFRQTCEDYLQSDIDG